MIHNNSFSSFFNLPAQSHWFITGTHTHTHNVVTPRRPSGEPQRAFGINQSGQSGRLPRDWEEMGPNGIRLWPGRWCLQPCHSILPCDCDHSGQTPQIAGNKNERKVLDWNSDALRKRTHVGGNQEAERWRGQTCSGRRGGVETNQDVNRGFYHVKPLSVCLFVGVDHPLIEGPPKVTCLGFLDQNVKLGKQTRKNWSFLRGSHPAFRINEPIYYFCQSSNTYSVGIQTFRIPCFRSRGATSYDDFFAIAADEH